MASMSATSHVTADHGHEPSILAFNVVMTVAAVIVIGLRFYSKTTQKSLNRQNVSLWWDDWLALATMPFVLAATVLICVSAHMGFSSTEEDAPTRDLERSAKLMVANYFVHDVALTLGRVSILLLYTRIFQARPFWFKTSMYIVHKLNAVWFLAAVLAKALICQPTSRIWDDFIQETSGSLSSMWLGVGITDALIDAMILVSPLPLVLTSNRSLARQLVVAGMFACGCCVTVISIGRTVTTVQTSGRSEPSTIPTSISNLYWLSAELPTLILAITLPSLIHLPAIPKLFRQNNDKLTPLPTIKPTATIPHPEKTRPTAPTGSNSARSSYLSSNYTAYAEYTGEKRNSLGSMLHDEDKDIHVENVVTVSTQA